MEILKSTGKYDIVESGSVIIPYGDYVQFEIESLVFRISFPCSDNSQQRMAFDMEKDANGVDIMHVKAFNFQNSFFTTPSKMLALAKDQGRQLYLNFSVTSVNSREGHEDKLFFYTWYLEKQEGMDEKKGGDDVSGTN